MKKTTERPSIVSAVLWIVALGLSPACPGAQAARSTLTVDAARPGAKIGPHLFGIFFEEINHAGDGGLYAELVRNRSFEDASAPESWSAVGSARISIDRDRPINSANRNSLRVEVDRAEGGAANGGYWGIAVEKGAKYLLTFYARAGEDFGGTLAARIESASGKVLAEGKIEGIGAGWKRLGSTLTAGDADPAARLIISASSPGTFWLDAVSLFPEETWKRRPNGLRKDLAGLLDELRPSFVRFPGGCFVEGNRLANASRWKLSIGDISERPGHPNQIWGYRSTDGLGYLEYLQMCEDLGAEPLFVINCGMAHEDVVPMKDLDEWVQDALDAVEYANGPADTRWGALRARHGHPAPFGLKYLEIGNENGGPAYEERYARFWDALKKAHPEVQLIANVSVKSRPMDILDEHYYSSPEFFRSNASRYDRYDRKGPRIYVGEYACTQGCGKGNLIAALGEAAFMAGMERNADIVVMSSYAPLFVNTNDRRWNPDAICFDSSRAYGTPSYHAQKLFSRNRGDLVLPLELESRRVSVAAVPGAIGLGTWVTQAEYKDLKVTAGDKVLFESDFSGGAPAFKVFKGDWKVQDGAYRQMSREADLRATAGDPAWTDYTYTLKARKIAGAEGFLIMFRVRDDLNWYWWNIGGWGNVRHAIEKCSGGSKTTVGQDFPGKVETGRWYDVKIELEGVRIRCSLDGKLIHDVEEAPTSLLSASASLAKSGEIILKVVNFSESPEEVGIRLEGCKEVSREAAAIVLTSASPQDENSLEEPEKVAPVESKFQGVGKEFDHTFRPNSLTILRIRATR